MDEVDKLYDDFWKELVETDGQLDLEKIKKELFDYRFIMDQVSKVYDHITGVLSKPNYHADTVIAAYEDRLTEIVDEEIRDRMPDREALASVVSCRVIYAWAACRRLCEILGE